MENEDDMEYLITWSYNGEQLDLSSFKEREIDCDSEGRCSAI